VEEVTLHVDRVLKTAGAIISSSENMTIHCYAPQSFIGWPPVRLHFYGLYFLKFDGSSRTIGFTDPIYPFVPALPQTRLSGSNSNEQVVNEISSFLYVKGIPLNDQMAALAYLGHSRSQYAASALRTALSSNAQELRYIAADKLIERNDISGLPVAKAALLHWALDTPDVLVENMSNAIGIGFKDPDAIKDLTELLNARSPNVRRNTALALVHTQSQQALIPLLSALNDSDHEVSYYGAIGLAEISGQLDWRPSMGEFDADPVKYKEHWSEWERLRGPASGGAG
jgi:hypothetical protein